jgi:hypothetical protein
MTLPKLVTAAFAAVLMGAGGAFALDQMPPPSAAPAAVQATAKRSLSKRCLTEANARHLHGKARTEFRTACITKAQKSPS